MGNALLSFRGLEIPAPANVELPSIWSQADGTFNNIWCNSITVAEPPGPAQVPAVQIVEYFNSAADFARLDISSQPNGPYLIQTDGANRGLTEHATGTLTIDGDNQLILASGTNPMQFWTGGGAGTLQWNILTNGEFQPATNNARDIGDTTNMVRAVYAHSIINADVLGGGAGILALNSTQSGAIRFNLGGGGAAAQLALSGSQMVLSAFNGLSFPLYLGGTGNAAVTVLQMRQFGSMAMIPCKSGVPTDADITSLGLIANDGGMMLDTTDNRIYFRSSGLWKYASLT